MPSLLESWVTVKTANAMSGCILTARCMRELTAAQYGMCFIRVASVGELGAWLRESWIFGSIGIDSGLRLEKLYFVSMVSTYVVCESAMVQVSQSHVTFIPSSQLIGLRSEILYRALISSLNALMRDRELLVRVQSSTWLARINMS